MPHPAYAPPPGPQANPVGLGGRPLDQEIPVEPGYFHRLAAACLRLALADARASSPGARQWLGHTGCDWAESLAPGKGGSLVRDVLDDLERRGEGAYRRLMGGA